MNSLIQSYINRYTTSTTPQTVQQIQEPVKIMPPVISQDSLRTHVRAYEPIGHIIKTNRFSLSDAFDSDINSLKFFAKGIRGRGNDYTIGKINDVAIKLGALGIAGIIATSKGSPLNRGMEFVGMICWLGAMSLWPKLAINLPIKALKGVDLDMEYQTANKKRKSFYQDPQFICWDMISDREMHRMGDKLGVPRTIKNRRQAIEKKARQVAIQGNTLAMLTAGFSTPLAASLAADQIGKRAISPMIEKIQEAKASKMEPVLQNNVNTLLSNASKESNILNSLTETLTPQSRQELLKKLTDLTTDTTLKEDIKSTLAQILEGKNATEMKTVITDEVSTKIAQLFSKEKMPSQELIEQIKTVATEYGNEITPRTQSRFIKKLEDTFFKNHTMGRSEFSDRIKDIIDVLKDHKTVKLTSLDEAKAKITDFARLLTTYENKFHKDFQKKYFSYIWNGQVSTTAKVWEQMRNETLKTLGFDTKALKEIANAPSDLVVGQRLSKIILNITQDPAKYQETIEKLGVSAAKVIEKNEKHLQFSLKYLDDIQKLLTAYDKKGELGEFANTIGLTIAEYRKQIIGKYLSANANAFLPIRVLNILHNEKSISQVEYKTLERILFSEQTIDSFINRLDQFKGIINNEADYSKFVEKVFANISDDVRNKLPRGLAEKIDDSTQLIKHILVTQCDGVNKKYGKVNSDAIVNLLKKLNLSKYVDDIFTVDAIKNHNGEEGIKNWIKNIINSNPQKLEELKTFLKLSSDDIASISRGDYSKVQEALLGSHDLGKGFLENGKSRFRTLLNFFGNNDIREICNINVLMGRTRKGSYMQGDTFLNFIKESAKDALSYKSWLKKVGYSFVGLCAITAIAILNFGKDNEYYRIKKKDEKNNANK